MRMASRRLLAAGMALGLATGVAFGQYGKPKNKPPKDSQEPKILERLKPHDWTLTTTVTVRIDQSHPDSKGMPTTTGFKFDTASVIFPVLVDTASSVTAPTRPAENLEEGRPYAWGRLMLNDQTVDEHPSYLTDYPCGVRLGKWIARDWAGQEVSLEVKLPVTSYQTRFDEKTAALATWPDAWPDAAASCFKAQYWIDADPKKGGGAYDMAPVKDLVKRATAGKDPKAVGPVMLAKVLAMEVMEAIQPSGQGLNFARTGELEGVDLKGAPQTILDGRGSDYDMVCVLAAVYRAAGLPARTVIGLDVGESKADGKKFLGKRGSSELRAWVEFALMDPKDSTLVWVPVDVVRMRKSGSRSRPFNQAWPFFGTNDELDRVIPFAFQFHPPTTVVSHGSPAFWGWLVTPKPPDQVIQTVRFSVITTPVTAEEQRRRREEKENGQR